MSDPRPVLDGASQPGVPRSEAAQSATAASVERSQAIALLGGIALVWGCHWPIVKIALGTMGPFTFALVRMLSALVTAVVIVGLRGRLRRPERADWPVLFTVALGQVAAGAIFMNLGLKVMAAGRASVLVYTMPLWVAVLQAVFFRVRPSRGEWLGLALGLIGLALILNPASMDWTQSGELLGAGLLLVAAISQAGVTIHVRRHPWRTSPEALLPWQFLVAFVPFLLVAPLMEPGLPIAWDPRALLVLVYSGPIATAFAAWASQVVARSLGAQVTTIGFLGVPLVGLVSGAILLGERLALADLAGFGLIAAGVVSATRRGSARTAAGPPP